MFLGQKFPKSEASEKGLSMGEMLKDVGIIGAAVIGLFVALFVKDGLGPLLEGLYRERVLQRRPTGPMFSGGGR